ncbi:hypothetical protein KQX54_014810 [Cotesia glomerata]|uniref:Uncharacterized protein n=1 Tax=Cotesia glomerata TaxID=32391 RepID=A0AAV7IVP3_COTGL|nr:hypothetical protein KQX54_014810 [Cotesia glomerata]
MRNSVAVQLSGLSLNILHCSGVLGRSSSTFEFRLKDFTGRKVTRRLNLIKKISSDEHKDLITIPRWGSDTK